MAETKEKKKRKGLWWKIPVWIIGGILAAIILFVVCMGANFKGRSFLGNGVNNIVKFANHICIRTTGQTMTYLTTGEQAVPYDFTTYTAPEGYTAEEVQLDNCRGFTLVKADGDHSKVVYHLHGGGYIGTIGSGDFGTTQMYSERFNNADGFLLDYRTAPDNLYPCALEDAVAGFQYLLEQGYAPENILVTGDSAGGGLALAMTLYLRDNDMALPGMLCLASPWTDLSASGESYTTNVLNDAIFGSIKAEDAPQYPVPVTYAGDNDLTDPYISPVYGDYTGMPPMLIQAGSTELLLSDSVDVAEKAKAAGVDAECIVYDGMMHTFYVLLTGCKEGVAAWDAIEVFIAEHTAG